MCTKVPKVKNIIISNGTVAEDTNDSYIVTVLVFPGLLIILLLTRPLYSMFIVDIATIDSYINFFLCIITLIFHSYLM